MPLVLLFTHSMCVHLQVEGFWRLYNHMMRPNDLPNTMDYHLFKTGIKPMWEVRYAALCLYYHTRKQERSADIRMLSYASTGRR